VAPPVTEALDRFLSHARLSDVDVAVVGAGEEAAMTWRRMADSRAVRLLTYERLDAAVTAALERAAYQLVRRR